MSDKQQDMFVPYTESKPLAERIAYVKARRCLVNERGNYEH